MGSGNIGATNVGRAAGPAAGVAALFLDAAKGALPALAALAPPASDPFAESARRVRSRTLWA